jgi:hypothetical protein
VTTSFGDLLDGTNSDKTRSMVGAQNGGKILNIEKNSPSDTFLLGGINYNTTECRNCFYFCNGEFFHW